MADIKSDIKSEPLDDSTEDTRGRAKVVESDAGDGEQERELQEPFFVQVKEEPLFESTSGDFLLEEICGSNGTTRDYSRETRTWLSGIDNTQALPVSKDSFLYFDGHGASSSSVTDLTTSKKLTLGGALSKKFKGYQGTLNATCKGSFDVASDSFLGDVKTNIKCEPEEKKRRKNEKLNTNATEENMRARDASSLEISLEDNGREPVEKKPFFCEIRGKRLCNLKVASGERPFPCSVCERRFVRKSHLVDHMEVHGDVFPFTCRDCGKSFRRSDNLRVHMRIHSGDKPFECEICKKTFTHSNTLTTHIRTHSGEKPFKCEHCDKAFAVRCGWVEHTRTHVVDGAMFKCAQCEKEFSQRRYLYRHMRTHSGEMPYTCLDCGRSFTKSKYLSAHSHRVHGVALPSSDTKRFKCN